jgi:TATA-box binding protein (TBP) (component of TFIID and TFIIIB)
MASATTVSRKQLDVPVCDPISISTKTKIIYFNVGIDLFLRFWDFPMISYDAHAEGVIKKQIKLNFTTKEEVELFESYVKKDPYIKPGDIHTISKIDNPNGRIKFKDIRKISVGISKKDIMSYRCKQKSAFYNCFVMIMRIKIGDIYKEFHVKVFNTGKLEIPGVKNEDNFKIILGHILQILQPHIEEKLDYKKDSDETVLINSNFNCGFFINRESLYDTLKSKYNLQAIYDPCSYPGIQCKFYYNPDIGIQNGCQISEENKHLYQDIKEVSFMIFRTGSVLIVGKCDENILMQIYEFLKIILSNEFKNICQKNDNETTCNRVKDKKKKLRKKNIIIEFEK